jgi:hypothetical protein
MLAAKWKLATEQILHCNPIKGTTKTVIVLVGGQPNETNEKLINLARNAPEAGNECSCADE